MNELDFLDYTGITMMAVILLMIILTIGWVIIESLRDREYGPPFFITFLLIAMTLFIRMAARHDTVEVTVSTIEDKYEITSVREDSTEPVQVRKDEDRATSVRCGEEDTEGEEKTK